MFTENRPNSAEYSQVSVGTASAFLTLTLNGDSGQLHFLATLRPKKESPDAYWMEG
jgi:hypothetical protein